MRARAAETRPWPSIVSINSLGAHAAEGGQGLGEPARHPGSGVEIGRVAGVLDHGFQLADEFGEAYDPLAFFRGEGFAVLGFLVDGGGRQIEGLEPAPWPIARLAKRRLASAAGMPRRIMAIRSRGVAR